MHMHCMDRINIVFNKSRVYDYDWFRIKVVESVKSWYQLYDEEGLSAERNKTLAVKLDGLNIMTMPLHTI